MDRQCAIEVDMFWLVSIDYFNFWLVINLVSTILILQFNTINFWLVINLALTILILQFNITYILDIEIFIFL